MFLKRFVILNSCLAVGLLSLSGCANSPLGNALERSLAPDSNLENNPIVFGRQIDNSTTTLERPADFPAEIPLYPNARLVSATTTAASPDATASPTNTPLPTAPSPTATRSPTDASPSAEISVSASSERQQTLWATTDSIEQVKQFYQRQLQQNGWQIQRSPTSTRSNADDQPILAERNGLQVAVEVPARPTSNSAQTDADTDANTDGNTEFTLTYRRNTETTAANSQPSPEQSPLVDWWAQAPTASTTNPSPSPSAAPSSGSVQNFSDINQAPEELQSYINDLLQLGVLSFNASGGNTTTSNQFKPNQATARRDYARWLVATNNRLYSDRPANKIRLGVSNDQPAFQDVPRTDPDFGAIQGLAEAGLIPSPLSGASTTVNFRPDAPLTREDLIRWKTPLDVRQTLPTATVQAVQETWGFQDANRIDPGALRSILADYQNGDLSNIRRAFGFTTLFQPKKEVTRAEAAATLWYFGYQGEGISAEQVLRDGE